MTAAEAVEAMLADVDLSPAMHAKAAAARRLAAVIDSGEVDVKSIAGVVREFRASLDDLSPKVADDGNADWTAAAVGRGGLLAVVRDATESEPSDPRPSGRRGGRKAG